MLIKRFLFHPLGTLLLAFLWVLVVYSGIELVSTWLFSVQVRPESWIRDITAHSFFAAFLYAMARNLRTFAVAYLVLICSLHLGNALKMAILGSPVMPDDFIAMSNMLLLFDGWRFVGAVVMVGLPIAALMAMIHWRKATTWFSLGLISVSVTALATWPQQIAAYMDNVYGDWVWNQPGNYRERGLIIHVLQETARNLSRTLDTPGEQEIKNAILTLNPDHEPVNAARSVKERRNLHIILLESFWDPMSLDKAGFSADPIDPEFRKLWRETGDSTALAPVFGGYTANSEFEVLCGFPVTVDKVFFEGWLSNDAPCLPRHLQANGYHTIASHPNAAAFWNRHNAYRYLGVQTYWSKRDFELDDMNRVFLSDESLYRQVHDKIKPMLDEGIPVMNYIVTYFGHMEYPLNERRPTVITIEDDNDMLARYANQMYYKSRELMAFIKQLREEDPDGIIIAFGDHLPFLGPNYAGYTKNGMLADKRVLFTDKMFHTYTRTPLIVIDGQNGPVKLGEVPMYQLPGIMLDLLGDHRPSILRMGGAGLLKRVRPLPGLHLVLNENGDAVTCRDNDESQDSTCSVTSPVVDALERITFDIFNGRQYALKSLPDAQQVKIAAPGADDY